MAHIIRYSAANIISQQEKGLVMNTMAGITTEMVFRANQQAWRSGVAEARGAGNASVPSLICALAGALPLLTEHAALRNARQFS